MYLDFDRQCRLKHDFDCLNTHMRRVCRAVVIAVASAVDRPPPRAGTWECLCCRAPVACRDSPASSRERSAKREERGERHSAKIMSTNGSGRYIYCRAINLCYPHPFSKKKKKVSFIAHLDSCFFSFHDSKTRYKNTFCKYTCVQN